MGELPRIAVGSLSTQTDLRPVTWAIMCLLEESGIQVQSFLSTARHASQDAAARITGRSPRHLDAWLMSREVCRDIFAHGARSADLSLIEGCFTPGTSGLNTICRWLDVPKIAVLDTARMSPCGLPPRPEGLVGVMLDRTKNVDTLAYWTTILESHWDVPVLGAMPACPSLRAIIDHLPPGTRPSERLCGELAAGLRQSVSLRRLLELAGRRPLEPAAADLFCYSRYAPGATVAYALDDAFNCYFPDALDMLEARGAYLTDFSPLSEESLPEGTDMVYLGCGHPERLAEALAENHCMLNSLRRFIAAGGRVYAEGGGLAYLCQEIEATDGRRHPMVGALDAVARPAKQPAPPVACEVSLPCHSWVGDAGLSLRGYLSGCWRLDIHPDADVHLARTTDGRPAVLCRHGVVGSLMHLNFAAQNWCPAEHFVRGEAVVA